MCFLMAKQPTKSFNENDILRKLSFDERKTQTFHINYN